MGLKLYDETSVQAIANAIRANNGSNNTYTISEMSTAIEKIDKGGTHTETKTVTFLNTTTPFNVGDNFLSGYGVYSQDNSYALAIAVSDGVGFAARLHNGVVDGYSAACTYSNGVFTFDSAFVLNYMGNSVYSLNCLFGNGGIYKYHWSNDGTICAREGVGETKWFFKGYVTNNGQDPYPNELAKFVPTLKYDEVILGPAYSTSDATEQVGWIGFYKTYIRVWSMNKGTLQGGTFYGVVDAADKTAEQHEVYTDPLDIQDIDISLLEKTITANGTYSAEDDGYFGYSDVVVNIDQTPITPHRILYDTWHIYSASQGWAIGGKNYLSYVYKVDANKTYLILFGDGFSGNILNAGFSTTDNWAESKSLTKVVMLSSPTNGSGIYITTEEDGYIVADVGENTNYGNILEIYCYEMPTTSDMNGFNPASINWDFTNSLESNTGITVVLHGVTRLSTGISIDSATNSYIEIPIGLTPKFIYEIDISDAVWSGDTSAHGRLIMNTTDSYGFIWRYHSQQWGYYDGNWVMDEDPSTHTEVTNPNAFDNKTLKMLFDSSNKLSVYADETLVYRSTRAISINYNVTSVTIGSPNASFNSMNITGLRIYPNINR